MDQFGDAGHSASWAWLCPGNHENAGKQYSSKTRSGNVWLKRILCQVAWAASHTRKATLQLSSAGSQSSGKRTCRLAVAHAMPVTIYAMSEKQQTYHEIGADYFAPASRGWADMTPQVQNDSISTRWR